MDILTASERSARMSLIRSQNTKPEIKVRKLVYGLGYRYRLNVRALPGKPDLVFRSRRCAIFIHGCFWHLHQGCKNNRPPKSRLDYWKPKLQANVYRDKAARQALRRDGWRVLTVWECEIANVQKLANRIERFLGPLSA